MTPAIQFSHFVVCFKTENPKNSTKVPLDPEKYHTGTRIERNCQAIPNPTRRRHNNRRNEKGQGIARLVP